jgi:AcrR family transcriptional regulator
MSPRLPTAKGAARREEIVTVAMRMVGEGGARTSLRSIGRELGVEPAQILYYFTSREDLLREVIETWDKQSAQDLVDVEDKLSPLRHFSGVIRRNLQIQGVVHLYLTLAADSVDEDHPAHAFFRERFQRVSADLAAAIRAGQDAGLIDIHLDPARKARQLVALADGLQLQSLIDPAIDAPADLDAAIDDLFTGKR